MVAVLSLTAEAVESAADVTFYRDDFFPAADSAHSPAGGESTPAGSSILCQNLRGVRRNVL
jgi:hypothetical protein